LTGVFSFVKIGSIGQDVPRRQRKKTKEKRQYKDRREYIIKAVQKRRKRIKEKAINYKGSKCEACGYSRCYDALEFHHIENNKKEFGISEKGYTRGWEKVKSEIEKCLLLCSNCHRELHGGILKIKGYGDEIVQASGKLEGNL